jgi:hypothetical protein
MASGNKPQAGYCLAGLAAVAGGQGQARRAAQLVGASEAQYSRRGIPPRRPVRAMHARTADVARAVLGPEACAAAWAEGQALALEEALTLALEGTNMELHGQ